MSGMAFMLLGILMFITPSILMKIDGVDPSDNSQIIQWLMSKSFEYNIMMRYSVVSGIGFFLLGLCLYTI